MIQNVTWKHLWAGLNTQANYVFVSDNHSTYVLICCLVFGSPQRLCSRHTNTTLHLSGLTPHRLFVGLCVSSPLRSVSLCLCLSLKFEPSPFCGSVCLSHWVGVRLSVCKRVGLSVCVSLRAAVCVSVYVQWGEWKQITSNPQKSRFCVCVCPGTICIDVVVRLEREH